MSTRQRKYKVTKPGSVSGSSQAQAGKAAPSPTPKTVQGPAAVPRPVSATPRPVPVPVPAQTPRPAAIPRPVPATRPGFQPQPVPAAGTGGRLQTTQVPAAKYQKITANEEPASKPGHKGGRKYKVITPGRKGKALSVPAETKVLPIPSTPHAARTAIPEQKRRSAQTRPAASMMSAGKPITRGRTTAVPGRSMRKDIRTKQTEIKIPQSKNELTGEELSVMKGLEAGPVNIRVLTRRTNIPSSKLMTILKRLTDSKLVYSKRIGKTQKYRLTRIALDLLNPPKFPATLFSRKSRKRKRGRRLSRKQRIKRYDQAIVSIIATIIALMLIFVYLYYQLDKKLEEDGIVSDDIDSNKDTLEPLIEWRNPIEIFSEPFGTLEMQLLVVDNDNRTPISGVNMKTLKIQYAFASNKNLLKPDLSNWSWIVPQIDPPFADITIARNWAMQEGNYVYIRCSVEDYQGNFAVQLFKILISFGSK